MTPEVPAICASLTKAQREVILDLRPGLQRRAIAFSGQSATRLTWSTKKRPALLNATTTFGGKIAWYFLNANGLAVRAQLLKEQQP